MLPTEYPKPADPLAVFAKDSRHLPPSADRAATAPGSIQLLVLIRSRRFLVRIGPVGRLDAEQMTHEEIEPLVLAVRAAWAVSGAGNVQKIEILVVFDQLIDHLHRGRGINVVIQFADD